MVNFHPPTPLGSTVLDVGFNRQPFQRDWMTADVYGVSALGRENVQLTIGIYRPFDRRVVERRSHENCFTRGTSISYYMKPGEGVKRNRRDVLAASLGRQDHRKACERDAARDAATRGRDEAVLKGKHCLAWRNILEIPNNVRTNGSFLDSRLERAMSGSLEHARQTTIKG
jgi:hypothetical protein